METLVLIARVTLAAVLAVAGAAKLGARDDTRRASRALGAPARMAAPIAVVLPLAELALAGALLPASSAPMAAVAAAMLLAVFTAAVAVTLARGRRPACRCFGARDATPIGGATLVRNGVLLTLAVVIAVAGGRYDDPSAVAWIARLDAGEAVILAASVVAIAAVATSCALALSLLRRHGALLRRIDELEARLDDAGILAQDDFDDLEVVQAGPAPRFAVPAVDGARVTLDDLLEPGRPVLLVFTDAACEPCSALLPEIAGWQRDEDVDVTIAVLAAGDVAVSRAKAAEHGIRTALLDAGDEVADAYGVTGTPSAALVLPDGMRAGPVAAGPAEIRSLLGRAAGTDVEPADGLAVGASLPDVRLPRLEGGTLGVEELPARSLLVFWNSRCGFCQELRQDLADLEHRAADGAPALVIVATGAVDAVAADGFSVPVVLDEDDALAGPLGIHGTPMAVLVEDGRVACELAAGGSAIRELLTSAADAAPARAGR